MRTEKRIRNDRHENHELVPDGLELWFCATCWEHVRRPRCRRAWVPAPTLRR
ncbi:hypothetical protein [Cellulomonas sp. Y8]|uniref:hypothetical protein n=1 Tax=Cellulomonas sp. Y8 TaxID=2591145 RepID=UPI003D727CD5